jgi:hypothetical protein
MTGEAFAFERELAIDRVGIGRRRRRGQVVMLEFALLRLAARRIDQVVG